MSGDQYTGLVNELLVGRNVDGGVFPPLRVHVNPVTNCYLQENTLTEGA
jgi:hypothetical protein